MEEIAKELIAFDTVSHKENLACSEFLADRLDSLGFSVELFKEEIDGQAKAQILASIGPSVNREGLILSGHMDIVPFEDQPGWTRDPLRYAIEDDKIYGRGTTDMKYFLAQCLEASKNIDKKKLKAPLTMLFTCDEEICCQGAKRLIPLLKERMKSQPLPSQALIGEPTAFDVFHAHKGVGVFSIKAIGKGGHSSRPDLGLNAVSEMARLIQCIEEYNLELSKISNPTNSKLYPDWPYCSINVGPISGGVADNMIPELCSIKVSTRSTTDLTPEMMVAELRSRVDKIGLEAEVSWSELLIAPALLSSEETPLLKSLLNWNSGVSGGAPFATDAGCFMELGIDSYICGPGLLSEAHQPNESMPLENSQKGLEMIEKVIRDLCY
ncbi:MAG: acetylornithine deacetylase [Halobacteriovoraceae bacterium]|jgi:acetylornithine deacetylase|nr:acetylornithine deacetylase [Halobacteriovoraceae bacterium]MBT5094226.1 acetylornithine deacetylase [Halobacteriovoraceae bacterium]